MLLLIFKSRITLTRYLLVRRGTLLAITVHWSDTIWALTYLNTNSIAQIITIFTSSAFCLTSIWLTSINIYRDALCLWCQHNKTFFTYSTFINWSIIVGQTSFLFIMRNTFFHSIFIELQKISIYTLCTIILIAFIDSTKTYSSLYTFILKKRPVIFILAG